MILKRLVFFYALLFTILVSCVYGTVKNEHGVISNGKMSIIYRKISTGHGKTTAGNRQKTIDPIEKKQIFLKNFLLAYDH